jgi:hypothetical protein
MNQLSKLGHDYDTRRRRHLFVLHPPGAKDPVTVTVTNSGSDIISRSPPQHIAQ